MQRAGIAARSSLCIWTIKVSAPNAVNVVSARNASVVVRLTTIPQKMLKFATSACYPVQYSFVGAKSFPGATATHRPNHTGRGYDDSFAPKHHCRQCGSSCCRTGVRLLHGLLSLFMTCTMQYIKYILKYIINLYL